MTRSAIDRKKAPAHDRPTREIREGVTMSLNLAPMIDVTFLLLIFFVLTTTFKPAEGILGARLPKDTGVQNVMLPISPIVIRVEPYHPLSEAYSIKIDNFREAPATPEELTAFLRSIHTTPGFDASTPVVLVPDQNLLWESTVDCWNAAVRAGCQNISFGRGGS